ncbi:MAG: helix-turn-helix transcriptional regulator [Coriobacteriales bacterium]|nr:helix-turn-helix transcriptional regulator [Coriobacteriales bacterium]
MTSALREAQGLGQRALAQCVGVNESAYGKWERNENQLKLADAAKIADLLGCKIDDLVGREARELGPEMERHEALERQWALLNHEGKTKLLDYARLLALDPNNTRKSI